MIQMALYRIRNNLSRALYLPTRKGFVKLAAKQTRQLDLVDPNSRRMRSRQQAGHITLLSVVDPRTGRLSPAMPKLHLGVGGRSGGALPTAPALTGTPAAAKVGEAFTFTPGVTGGQGPRSFAVRGGALPAGLTLSASTGVISGTPTAAGSVTRTLVMSDNAGVATRSITIAVAV